MTDVRWERTLVVDVTLVTNEFGDDSETLTEAWRITKEGDVLTVRTPGNSCTYHLSPEVIEAIYDLHVEVPR